MRRSCRTARTGTAARLQQTRRLSTGPARPERTQTALENMLTSVNSAVILHMMPQLERLPTELALERAVARVDRQVRDQRRHVREALAAELAQHHVPGLHGADVQVERRLLGRRAHVGRLAELADQRQPHRPAHQRVAVLQRVERVRRQNVPRQFALVRERRPAMYARVRPLPLLDSPPTGPFVLLQPQKEHQLLFLSFILDEDRNVCNISNTTF